MTTPIRRLLSLSILLLAVVAAVAEAATPRAWLDRERIRLGETVALTVEAEGLSGEPDFSVLPPELPIRSRTSSSQVRLIDGTVSRATSWSVVLEPNSVGEWTVPAIAIGDRATEPLRLTVEPAPSGTAAAGEPIFLETEVSSDRPHAGQLVLYTLRLHYAIPLIEGALDAPVPEGGDLRQLGTDTSYRLRRENVDYNVVERHYALIPERSGPLTLSAARFRGRVAGGDSRGFAWLGGRAVAVTAAERVLDVRPRPPNAALPWLPVEAASLALDADAGPARVGEPHTLTQTVRVRGAVSEQLVEPPVPDIEGAQVFAEPAEFTETVRDGAVVLEWRRPLAVVPLAAGELTVPEQSLHWWNTATEAPAQARSPALRLTVLPATAAVALPGPEFLPAPVAPSVAPSGPGFWPWLSLLLALGWAGTLWHWQARAGRPRPVADRPAPHRTAVSRRLRQALAAGDLSDIGEALRELAPPPRPLNLTALAERLRSDAQRQAIRALQEALWGGGDREQARQALRAAFAQAPKFAPALATPRQRQAPDSEDPLPPLYPGSSRNSARNAEPGHR